MEVDKACTQNAMESSVQGKSVVAADLESACSGVLRLGENAGR